MSEERARILQMVSENKIDAEQGVALLNALRTSAQAPNPSGTTGAHWFRVRITDMETGRTKVNVNLPIGLVKVGLKLGARFAPEVEDLDWDELVTAIQEGASGKLVDVEDIEDGDKVEVYVE
jgi:hypothetical protein